MKALLIILFCILIFLCSVQFSYTTIMKMFEDDLIYVSGEVEVKND